ncbi:Nup54 and DDE 1 domain containing protein [Trichuris trichiura]|uniref:Nup54 and DDE 1 domain containing protein n=1 Tax=Trichuris trichiura TaxID=36087 RepID=A0A077ZGG6_TRITR|nr:Nup54 and DDE 1 domain containing protein [Trichuris trichiura]
MRAIIRRSYKAGLKLETWQKKATMHRRPGSIALPEDGDRLKETRRDAEEHAEETTRKTLRHPLLAGSRKQFGRMGTRTATDLQYHHKDRHEKSSDELSPLQPTLILRLYRNYGWCSRFTKRRDLIGNRTVQSEGPKSIVVKTTGHERTHFTVVLSCLANGMKLKPVVIFRRKGRPKEDFPSSSFVRFHENGWMDEQGVRLWIDNIWRKRPMDSNSRSLLVCQVGSGQGGYFKSVRSSWLGIQDNHHRPGQVDAEKFAARRSRRQDNSSPGNSLQPSRLGELFDTNSVRLVPFLSILCYGRFDAAVTVSECGLHLDSLRLDKDGNRMAYRDDREELLHIIAHYEVIFEMSNRLQCSQKSRGLKFVDFSVWLKMGCEVNVSIMETHPVTGLKHTIPATESYSFLVQPTIRMQLQSHASVDDLAPKVDMPDEKWSGYLCLPPAGFDPFTWKQAQLDNPDKNTLIPWPINGFKELLDRYRLQVQEMELQEMSLEMFFRGLLSVFSRGDKETLLLSKGREF